MTCRKISLNAPVFKRFKNCGQIMLHLYLCALLAHWFNNFPIWVYNSNSRGLLYRCIAWTHHWKILITYRLGFVQESRLLSSTKNCTLPGGFFVEFLTSVWNTLLYSQHCYYFQKSLYLIFYSQNPTVWVLRQTHLCETCWLAFLLCDNTGRKMLKEYLGTDYIACLDSPTT